MPDSDTVELDVTENVATVTIDRPEKLNALTVETLEALDTAIHEADEADARALVLRGAGDKAFVAGADISYMRDLSTPEAQAYAELGHRVASGFEEFPAPTIASIGGYAFGGGSELAIACDLRVASERAVIGQTEIELGIIPGWGGTQRLPRLVGDEAARRMIFFGKRMDADDAREIGLVGEVVSHERVTDRVRELATDLATRPRLALKAAKEALNAVHEEPQRAGLRYERRAWAGLFGTHDQREGMAAFLEDRDPTFQ